MNESVDFEPTSDDLEEVKSWLEDEAKEAGDGTGFINNWATIEAAHEQQQLAILRSEGRVIAFFTWHRLPGALKAHLEILSVHPDFRRAGYGTALAEAVETHLRDDGTLLVFLECEPPTSEPFWRARGYEDFPENHPERTTRKAWRPQLLCKLIGEQRPTSEVRDGEWKLEVFDEMWPREDGESWVYTVPDGDKLETLDPPIIVVGHYDWCVQLTSPAGDVTGKKAKYTDGFTRGDGVFAIGKLG